MKYPNAKLVKNLSTLKSKYINPTKNIGIKISKKLSKYINLFKKFFKLQNFREKNSL